jgi:hypothetical protein
MHRRRITLTLLLVLVIQMIGAVAFASVCVEPCPDDTEETSCPPVCSLCTDCTHAQTAVVRHTADAAPLMTASPVLPQHSSSSSSQLADDIFHVPLHG